jgi:hypothetical protein
MPCGVTAEIDTADAAVVLLYSASARCAGAVGPRPTYHVLAT